MNKPNISEIMEAAQKIQQNMKQTQQELSKLEVTGESGAGLVVIRVNGLRQVINVQIDPSALNETIEVIQTLIASAFNDAMQKVEKKAEEKVMDLAKGFNLPGSISSDEDAA